MERLKSSIVARSIKTNIKIIFDDAQPILKRINAMEGAEYAIRFASKDALNNGVDAMMNPDFEKYFKGLVAVAAKPMSE